MIVRAVQIDEIVTELFQHGESRRAAVDELAIGPGCAEDSLDQQLAVFARLYALVFEFSVDGAGILHVEDGLHGAAFRSGTDQCFVRSFTEDELQGADDDGFAGACFTGDGSGAWTERPLEFVDEREIANTQG